jgi:outer membrane lipoprotein-sorting protein
VYVKFLSPDREAGKEAIYKDGQIIAHGVGVQRVFGTLTLKPTSPLAMAGQRYPVTELGIKRLAERVVEVGSKEKNYGECTASVEEDSGTTCYTIEHPYPRKQFFFHVAKIFVRDKLPVRIQLFDWDKTLVEDYEYTNIKLNQGLTDRDFDSEEYGF